MKTLSLILLSSVLSFSTMANADDSLLKSVSTNNENLIKLRVDQNLVGATIQLIYSNGDVVAQELLVKKRMVIDFRAVKSGDYIVVIEKGDFKKHINIHKNLEEGVQFGIKIPISG